MVVAAVATNVESETEILVAEPETETLIAMKGAEPETLVVPSSEVGCKTDSLVSFELCEAERIYELELVVLFEIVEGTSILLIDSSEIT